MTQIPIHTLKDRNNVGLQLKRFRNGVFSGVEQDIGDAHRDDHYIFFFIDKGFASIVVDFHHISLNQNCLFYILPGQVHHRIQNEHADGWFMAIDTSLISKECRSVFENHLYVQQPYVLDNNRFSQSYSLIKLLNDQLSNQDTGSFNLMSTHALLQSFLFNAAGYYENHLSKNLKTSRLVQLTVGFKEFLVREIRTTKNPASYAELLNVTESYLNEVVKKTTGFPVSYWIHQEIMLEAKRLLFYTRLNVKQIAHNLGYDDHSYFSRLFRKVTGTTAIEFRKKYDK